MKRGFALVGVTTVFALVAGLLLAAPALAGPQIQLSTDPYTNPSSQHETQVEPDSFAFGNTIVATFQSGRFFDGGSSNIGWATSTDGGNTFTHGFLPGTTVFAGGTYDRISDPSVAFDAKHHIWMINSLAIRNVGANDVIVSRSSDGLTWNNPVPVSLGGGNSFYDKNWVACDNTQSSPFFGKCYVEWDDAALGGLLNMSASSDGGLTWGPPKHPANNATGIGGQPVVLASGKVVVPYRAGGINVFSSSDGGASWSASSLIASASYHTPAGGLRAPLLPTAEARQPGPVVVAWPDCRFESGCSANDIVFSSSTDGISWTAVKRIPIDPIGSGVDHFIPGIALQPVGTTPSTSTHIALGYYYYPVANCAPATCQLDVGFVFSTNGGATWSAPQQLTGPLNLSWIANTNQGRMVGDYMSTSYSGNNAFPVYASAIAPSGGLFHEAMFTNSQPALRLTGSGTPSSSAGANIGVGRVTSFPHTAY